MVARPANSNLRPAYEGDKNYYCVANNSTGLYLSRLSPQFLVRHSTIARRGQQLEVFAVLRSLIPTGGPASALGVPAVPFAQQSKGPVTCALVRSELVQLEKVGWRPARVWGAAPISRLASRLPKPEWLRTMK
jgi:hypothetical protein